MFGISAFAQTPFAVSPTAPTPTAGDNSTKVATTAFVSGASVSTATNIAGGAANSIPYQTGSGTTSFVSAPTTANQGLTWNGSSLVWQNPSATVASGCVYENGQTISSNYTMTSGNNGMSAGPITVATGVTVTIPSGSAWTIV